MQALRYVAEEPPPPPHPALLPMIPGNNWQDPFYNASHSKRHVCARELVSPPLMPKTVARPPSGMGGTAALGSSSFGGSSSGGASFCPVVKPNTQKLYECLTKVNPPYDDTEPRGLSLHDKVMRFFAWTMDPASDSSLQGPGLVRKVVISYYPADDTMTVVEPTLPNSGLPGGVFLKRHKVPRLGDAKQWRADAEVEHSDFPEKFLTVNDLKVGKDVVIYGRTFHIVDVDEATREFLEGLGTDVAPAVDYPVDPFMVSRQALDKRGQSTKTFADMDFKRISEQMVKGRTVLKYPTEIRNTQKFLVDDGIVLCFKAVWDDRDSPHGDVRFFDVRYYIADDTVEVIEKLKPNSGRDACRAFANRRRLPKDKSTEETAYNLTFSSRVNGGIPESDAAKYYAPADLAIGTSVNVYGRDLVLVDCDLFTRRYYSARLGIDLDAPIDPEQALGLTRAPPPSKKPPPHNGFGTEEDSLGNWRNLVLRAPKKDMKKWMAYSTKLLRFSLKFHEPATTEDSTRAFLLSFYLCDDTLQVTERSVHNTGFPGGGFLRRQKVKKFAGEGPACYYKWDDFYVGAVVNLLSHRFIVTEMDNFTLRFRYSKSNVPLGVTTAEIQSVLAKLKLSSADTSLQQCLSAAHAAHLDPADATSAAVVKVMTQFWDDHNRTGTVRELLEAVSEDPTPQELTAPAMLRKLKAAIAAQDLKPEDAFRLFCALPRSRMAPVGATVTNAINSQITPWQVSQGLNQVLMADFSELERDVLLKALFSEDFRLLSLLEFQSILDRLEP
eukprot:RCo021443